MSFRKLQDNLVFMLRDRVRNGELTERHLSKISGISQSHIHNILKGVRELTPGVADRILPGFRMSVRDLMNGVRLGGPAIPVVESPVGPGCPIPGEEYAGFHPFPHGLRAGLTEPVMFHASRDELMEPNVLLGDLVLVDRSPAARQVSDTPSLYLVNFDSIALFRFVRRAATGIYVIAAVHLASPGHWQHLDREGQDILEVVRGRIIWIGRQVETPARLGSEVGPPS